MNFYSANLIFIVLVDDGRPRKMNHYDESIVLFRAGDHGHAFTRALEIGKAREVTYNNSAGQDVRWAFVRVAKMRRVGKKVDGKEISSGMFFKRSAEPIPFATRFHPEGSMPDWFYL